MLSFLFLLMQLSLMSQSPTLTEMRSMYGYSIQDQDQAEAYYEKMTALQNKNALQKAYAGAAAALMGKHVFSPLKKLDYLAEADALFKEAVLADPSNPEIRFLRYSYQHYLPGFLGYSGDIESDQATMLSALRQRTEELRKDELLFVTMVRFLLDGKRCDSADNEFLQKLLSQS
jgi:tetratricopeptide (TPR) repeat protein